MAYINGHPAYGTAPGCGQLLQGPGKAWAEANMAAGARDEAAPFLPDEQMGSGPRGAVLEVPAVLAAESVLVLWSSVMHGSSGWMPPRPDAEAWKQVLCAALAAPRLAKQRKHTRRLLLALCGGHSSYRDARSAFLLERRLERLRALAAVHGTSPGDYTAKCDLLSALTAMLEVSSRCLCAPLPTISWLGNRLSPWILRAQLLQVVDLRPKCWRAMCGSHSDLLPWLIGTCPGWDEAHLVAALKLVRLALPSGSHHQQSQATPGSPHEGSSSGAVAVDVDWLLYGLDDALAMQGADSQIPLASFVTLFLLRPGGCSVRSEAAGVLRAAWRSLGGRAQGRLLAALLSWVPRLQPYGDSAAPYFELLSWMVKGGGSTSEGSSTSGTSPSKAGARASDGTQQLLVAALKLAIPGLSASLLGALRDVNASLADHPHAKAYEALRGLTEFEGYFLEGTEGLADADLASICLPPLVSDPTATGSSGAFTVTRLDTLRAETKYTANSVSYRLSGRYAIKAFSLQVHELRRSRTIAALSVHFCTAPLSELAELKHSPDLWHLALKAKLAPGQTVFKRQLPVPAVATALLIRLEDYHVNLQEASNETIQCPRCSHIVRDRHGVCGYCHENAHQCRQCRNINYECLDGFLCNECGHCRFGRLDFSVTAFTSSDYPPLITDEDVARALVALDREADALHRAQEEHSGLRPPLAAALSSCGSVPSARLDPNE